MAEAAVRELKGQIRAIRSMLEAKYNTRLAETEPVFAWIPRHVANVINRYRVGADGRTSEWRRARRQWERLSVAFGEAVFYRRAGGSGGAKKNSGESIMQKGIFVGHHERTGAILLMTPKGLERGVGLHQLPETARWDMAFLKECKGATVDREA